MYSNLRLYTVRITWKIEQKVALDNTEISCNCNQYQMERSCTHVDALRDDRNVNENYWAWLDVELNRFVKHQIEKYQMGKDGPWRKYSS